MDGRVSSLSYGMPDCPSCQKNGLVLTDTQTVACILCEYRRDFSKPILPLSKYSFSVRFAEAKYMRMRLLPEEYIAELRALERRLKKANISVWEIRQQLIHQFAFLLWAYCIRMPIENLFLDSNQKHHIDDD